MHNVVTSATPDYYPGVIALWNSMQLNSPTTHLTCFCYDDTDKFKALVKLGIDVILNASMPGPIIGKGDVRTGTGAPVNEDMYARLLVQHYFDEGRVFYVDADCLVLGDISELWEDLDMCGYASACVWRPDIGWKGGNIMDEMASGTFLADIEKWQEQDLTGQCFQAMSDYLNKRVNARMPTNVESVLSYVHRGKFLHLDRIYQNLTYYGLLSQEDKVAHFAGKKPWKQGTANYKQLWKAYKINDRMTIKKITAQLPKEKTKMRIEPKARAILRAKQDKWSS